MKRTPIQRLRAAATKFEEEPNEVSGYWRGHLVWVERVDENECWYIRVIHPDGGYLFDGYWSDSQGKDGADAVAEAFAGAELLEGDQ